MEHPDSYSSTSKSSSQSGNTVKNISKEEIEDTNSVDNLEHESNEEDTNSYNEEHEVETRSSIENYITNQLNNIFSISIEKSDKRLKPEHLVLHKETSKPHSSENEFSRENDLANDIDSNIIDREDLYITPKQGDIKNENIEGLDTQSEQNANENEHQMQEADSNMTNENLPIYISEYYNFVEQRNSKVLLPNNNEIIKNDEIKDENVLNNEHSQDILKTISTEEKEDLEQNTDYVVPKDVSVITLNTEQKKSDENNESVNDVQKMNENLHDENVQSEIPKDLNMTEILLEEKKSEEIADDKNKKVKFSNKDVGKCPYNNKMLRVFLGYSY